LEKPVGRSWRCDEIDGFRPTLSALRRMGMRNEFNFLRENPVKIRLCQYLNNSASNHGSSQCSGSKSSTTHGEFSCGIEFMQKIHKGQFDFDSVSLCS
jgi:hypothetical protein